VTNSLRHSGSAVPGGLVTVAACGEGVRIEVTVRSGDGVPVLKHADGGGEAEGSRGLLLVDALTARWGISGAVGSRQHGSSLRRTDPAGPGVYLSGTSRVPAGDRLSVATGRH